MKRQLAAMCLTLMTAGAFAQNAPASCANQPKRRIVVTIGIGNYASWDHLTSPVKDADAIETLLKSEFGYVSYTDLVPGPKLRDENAGLVAINDVVDHLGNLLCTDDDVIFFYSGHGDYQPDEFDKDNQQKWSGYLIPVDAPAKDLHEWSKLLSVSDLMNRLARWRARHILVILDACHSGIAITNAIHVPMAGPKQIDPGKDQAFVNDMESKRSRLLITAAVASETADENSTTHPGLSLFTAVLVDELESKNPAHGHSFIDASHLATDLKNDVAAESASKQHPDFGKLMNDQDGELILPLNFDYDTLCEQAGRDLADGDIDAFQVTVTKLAKQQPEDVRTTYWRLRSAVEQGRVDIHCR